MTQTLTKFERYLADFHDFDEGRGSDQPSWLRDIRQQSLAHFERLGFPTARRGNEAWKYTNVAPIARTDFTHSSPNGFVSLSKSDVLAKAPWNDQWTNLVFVDGYFDAELSSTLDADNSVAVRSLAEVIRSDDPTVREHLTRYAEAENDGFVALNTAFLDEGAVVILPEDTQVEAPVNIVFVSTGSSNLVINYPRVLVIVGRNSSAKVIESYVGLTQDRYFNNAVAEYVLETGAKLHHYRILLESDDAFHVGVVRVHQYDDSSFYSKVFEKSVGIGRYDLYNKLDGERCQTIQHGLYVTSGSQHVDNFINIDHTKPYSTSRLFYKGILADKSRAVFGGTVWVRPGAIKTDSKQEDRNLLLSHDAEIDSKPALFIWADDVLCGHGASAGKIDLDTVFYMRSRGIDLEAASRFLIYGFAAEIIETVEIEELRAYLETLFLDSLPAYSFKFE